MYLNRKILSGIIIIVVFLVHINLEKNVYAQRTAKPILHGRHWIALTEKPLAVNAGAAMFYKGGEKTRVATTVGDRQLSQAYYIHHSLNEAVCVQANDRH